MPAITRSQARKIVDHLSSAPYPAAALARAKIKAPVAVAKFEQLLKQETTPPSEELLDAVLQINVESILILNQENGMHIIGDILYEVTSTFRKWMTAKGYVYANTSAFFNRWKQNGGSTGYSNDTTLEAVRLREFVDETENQSENAKTQRYLQIKAWMRMYHQRCTLVHKSLNYKSHQEEWNSFNSIEADVTSGRTTFSDEDEKKFAIDAIQQARRDKFKRKDGSWIAMDGTLIKS